MSGDRFRRARRVAAHRTPPRPRTRHISAQRRAGAFPLLTEPTHASKRVGNERETKRERKRLGGLGPVQNSNIAAKTTPGTPTPCTNDTWYTSTRSTRRVWTTPARFGSRSLASGSACSHGSTRSAPACPSVPAIERWKNRLEGVARNASVTEVQVTGKICGKLRISPTWTWTGA